MKPLAESKLLLTGVIRNCAKTLLGDLERISMALSRAKSLNIFIVESDSDDDSINILQALKEINSNFDFISLGTLSPQFPKRTERISYCRNIYVNEIRNNSKYQEIDYVIVADLDGLNTEITSESVESSWLYQDWQAMTANQNGPYYDIWALRHNLWSPNDCWQQFDFFNHFVNNSQANLKLAVHSKMIEIPQDSEIIKVDSAFGGFGIYVKSIFDFAFYNGIAENGNEICEHVHFNSCINNLGGGVYINPKLINASYTDHTSHLISKSPNILVDSKYGKIIINKNDRYIGKNIVEIGYWAEDDIQIIIKLLEAQLLKKENLIFYDIGANIGTHTLAVANTFGNRINIRAFEAQRMIFNMLCGTVALNGHLNVNCHNMAVSDSQGNIEIKMPDYNHNNNFEGLELIQPMSSDNHDMVFHNTDFISTVTIDSFGEDIDFIKMDIEGMEDKAIKGAVNSIYRSRPICFIETQKTDCIYILQFFISLNYTGYKKGNDLIAIPNEIGIDINGLDKYFP